MRKKKERKSQYPFSGDIVVSSASLQYQKSKLLKVNDIVIRRKDVNDNNIQITLGLLPRQSISDIVRSAATRNNSYAGQDNMQLDSSVFFVNYDALDLVHNGCEQSRLQENMDVDWTEVESKAISRDGSFDECAICQQDFNTSGPQVILSCSHIFHLTCIHSFEKFLRSKASSCPLCRMAPYRKKETSIQNLTCKKLCSIRINAAARAFLARKYFYALLKRHVRDENDPMLLSSHRRKFYVNEFKSFSSQMMIDLHSRSDEVDELCTQLDQSLALSRTIFDLPGRTHEGEHTVVKRSPIVASTCPSYHIPKSRYEWMNILYKSKDQNSKECPICMTSFYHDPNESKYDIVFDIDQEGHDQNLTLLSCSHIFHASCIESFEKFNVFEEKQCPICRCHYERRKIKFVSLVNLIVETGWNSSKG